MKYGVKSAFTITDRTELQNNKSNSNEIPLNGILKSACHEYNGNSDLSWLSKATTYRSLFTLLWLLLVHGGQWLCDPSPGFFSLFYNHNGNGKQKPKQQIFYWPINRLCRAHRKKISFSILIFTLLEQPRLQWLQQQLLLFGLVLWMNFCATCLIN